MLLLFKIDSNIFELFSIADCSLSLNCASFFEKLMVKRRISYFKVFHLVWSRKTEHVNLIVLELFECVLFIFVKNLH